MIKFTVGQVIFILLRDDHRIAPVQVVEEVVHRKINGEEIKYYVRASNSPDAKILLLETSKQKIFLTIDDARQYMIENATHAIDAICNEAMTASYAFSEGATSFEAPEKPRQAQEMKKVKLPTGEIVNIQI